MWVAGVEVAGVIIYREQHAGGAPEVLTSASQPALECAAQAALRSSWAWWPSPRWPDWLRPGATPSVAATRSPSIAARNGTTVQALAFANGIRNPNFILIGQSLALPG